MTKNYKLHYHPNLNLEKETTIELKSVEEVRICPHCGIATSPTFIDGYLIGDNNSYIPPTAYIIFHCPSCSKLYIAKYYIPHNYYITNDMMPYDFTPIFPSCTYPGKHILPEFTENIKQLSPMFVETYRQACYAEENEDTIGLAGLGYRKAIEFLIKDYLIKVDSDNKDKIIKMQLGKCIDKLDEDIQDIAKAATWLGNDEVHYFKKHRDYGIDDMKDFIQGLVADIERYYVKLKAREFVNANDNATK